MEQEGNNHYTSFLLTSQTHLNFIFQTIFCFHTNIHTFFIFEIFMSIFASIGELLLFFIIVYFPLKYAIFNHETTSSTDTPYHLSYYCITQHSLSA